MKHLIQLDINFLRKKFILFLGVGLLVMAIGTVLAVFTHTVEHGEIDLWTISYRFFVWVFPLFCIIPCFYLFDEKQSGYMRYALLRTSKREYFFSKLLVGSVFSFLLMFLISFVGLIFALLIPEQLIMHGEKIVMGGGETYYDRVWAYDTYINNPIFYVFFVSVWRGIVAIVFYMFGITVAFLSTNKFLIAIIPFVYYHLENYFWAILGIFQTRTFYSVGLESAGIKTGEFGFAIWGPVIMASLLLIVYLIFIRKKIFKLIK